MRTRTLKRVCQQATEFYSSMAFCNEKTEEIKRNAFVIYRQPTLFEDPKPTKIEVFIKKINYYLGPLLELETYMLALDHVKKV